MEKHNIFVVGLDDFHLEQLQTLPHAENYSFHGLFNRAELKRESAFPVRWLIKEGESRLGNFSGRVDAIVGFWDFPVSTILPILRQRAGLPTTSLESVLKCEHKYWSRLEQATVVPDNIPRFCAVDPFTDNPLAQIDLEFPFWIKPVKAVLSHLGYLITSRDDFDNAIIAIRDGIGRFGNPFNYILGLASLPPEVAKIGGNHCIAESLISAGHQCTLEGYAYNGRVNCYGTVDSLREGVAGSSFSRYQYPSLLPDEVIRRMADIAEQIILHVEYQDSPFNIEFYWDDASDQIWLLEINTRISKSHAPLFYLVDGCYHHKVMIDLALGDEPDMPHRQGEYAYAAKFMYRCHENAVVTRVPTREEITDIENAVDGTRVQVHVIEDMWLSDLQNQDSYSYEVATVFTGGNEVQELEHKYRRVLQKLPLKFKAAA